MFTKTLKIVVFTVALAIAAVGQSIDTTVRIEPIKPAESPYVYVPFVVPAGTESVSVRVAFDKSKSRMDFGLFDSTFSGSDTDKRGFRGWSAYVRDAFFVGRTEASNGYQAGPLPGGTWRLIVGRSKIGPDGAELRLRIDFNRIDKDARERLDFERSKSFDFSRDTFVPPPRIKQNGFGWYRGDLHVHTFHGDGNWTVRAALESARRNGLDFVALTEHNTFTHHREIDDLRREFGDLLVIRGEEVTTYGGHINVWGIPSGGWVDFRLIPGLAASGRSIINEARAFGGLASVNHPTMACGGCSWTYDSDWSTLDSVEIWNATWDADDEAALKIWDGLLQKGRRITAVGSSDSHQPPYESSPYPTNLRVGDPSVFIAAKSLTQKSLFDGIRRGRVFVADNPHRRMTFSAGKAMIGEDAKLGPTTLRTALEGFPEDARLMMISDGAVIFEAAIGRSKEFKKAFDPKRATYVRIEIRSRDDKMLAMTNPIYFR